MQEMADLLRNDPLNTMEWKEEPDEAALANQLGEEKIMSTCLQNMKLHAKVKLLVHSMINEYTAAE